MNKYLKQLSKQYRTPDEVKSEMLNLQTILLLPKATEFFLSDLHGEYESFLHLLRTGSGVIKNKIDLCFNDLNEHEREELAHLIYYPERHLDNRDLTWYVTQIMLIMRLASFISRKYTRSKVSKKMPETYRYIITEMMRFDNRENFEEIVTVLMDIHDIENFMIGLCQFVRDICVDHLHIIGDFFDRGPRPDYIFEALAHYAEVDIQWGNHDVAWMGAACGNPALIAHVVRISLSYNNLDVLEDGYGINLRALSEFALKIYGEDNCDNFMPHTFDENRYDYVNHRMVARMHKAITIIETKLEGQLLARHEEYRWPRRYFLNDLSVYKDRYFPTVDPMHPYELSQEESQLMKILQYSFLHSVKLQKHVRYLYEHGGMYKVYNGNLLYHGCIPMNPDGTFRACYLKDGFYQGKELLDRCESFVREAFYTRSEDAVDYMWYLWCGVDSPLYGKTPHPMFENYFLDEKITVTLDPYYDHIEHKETCEMILREFKAGGYIINGHVPVVVKEGETPLKGEGKALIIDGGLSKAYYEKTGSSGYTLIFDSEHLFLAKHAMFTKDVRRHFTVFTPDIEMIQTYQTIKNKDTDIGRELKARIKDLEALFEAYKTGKMVT